MRLNIFIVENVFWELQILKLYKLLFNEKDIQVGTIFIFDLTNTTN